MIIHYEINEKITFGTVQLINNNKNVNNETRYGYDK